MRPERPGRRARQALLASCIAGLALVVAAPGGAQRPVPTFSDPARIDNPYLPLTATRRCELRGQEGGRPARIVRTVLERRERFAYRGTTVPTVIIEDRAYEGGVLVERTLDFFAQADDGTVYYFGEDVDNYRDGRIVDHHGAWRFGRDTSTLGVAMPARPVVGSRFRFEDVPSITVESDQVVARLKRVVVRGRTYRDVIRIRELLQPEGAIEHKLYARGVGLILEEPPNGRVELVGCR